MEQMVIAAVLCKIIASIMRSARAVRPSAEAGRRKGPLPSARFCRVHKKGSQARRLQSFPRRLPLVSKVPPPVIAEHLTCNSSERE